MIRCCNNCRHIRTSEHSPHKSCSEMRTYINDIFDTSKDYCSKYEEKEDAFYSWCYSHINISPVAATMLKVYFKQRIAESIDKIDPDTIYDEINMNDIRQAFDWILE